ncbi:hypothetical protein DICVIV_04692 [Dictyocaulus viviparus]|uniref:Uncharacterized protein n=1 Tax=Dictyocaulus viviparus TaxID=29172 RepID=A0A0D8Y3R7_DICVI|nr:hypothetical protein DICVIV_04692 [Dictyocaulus viviparus]
MFDDVSLQSSRDSCDFNHDRRRRHSLDKFYDHDIKSESGSCNSYSRRNSHDVSYGTPSHRFFCKMPMLPISEMEKGNNQDIYASKDYRHLYDVGKLYKKNRNNRSHQHRRNPYMRMVVGSYDANSWSRNGLSNPRECRSQFLRRKFLSTAAVSSLDSTNSTESSAPEAMFVSSMDSTGSDLEHRRLSLLNRTPTGSVPQIISRPFSSINEPSSSQQRRQLYNRDFSVDEKSDALFREWSRVDPAYEDRDTRVIRQPRRQLDRGVSDNQSTLQIERHHAYIRQHSANPVTIEKMASYICYPAEGGQPMT